VQNNRTHGSLVTAQRTSDHALKVSGTWPMTGGTVVIVIGEQTQVR
jgi:hypothetical protein